MAACVLVVFFAGLGAAPLTSPNEGLYAEVAREMAESGDPIVPRADGVAYFEKPPLLYWLVAACLRVFGENAFAARLPSALAAAATAWLLFLAGRRLFGGGSGAVAGVVFATSLGFGIIARQVMFDALLTLWTTAALLGFWFGTNPAKTAGSRRRLLVAAYGALALGVLTKGLLGVVLPLLVLAGYAAASRDFARLRAAWSARGLLLLLAIAVPWHVAAAVRQNEFVWFYFINEHWLRFLGRRLPPDFHEDPIYAPAAAFLFLVLPWTVLLPAAFSRALRERPQRTRRPEAVFLASWALAPVLFFTASRTRTYYYMLPIVPPLALLLGMFWSSLRAAGRGVLRSGWVLAPVGLLAAVVAAGWSWCAFSPGEPGTRGAAFRAVALAGGSWLVLGLAAAFLLARRASRLGLFATLAGAAVLTFATALGYVVETRPDAFVSEEPAAALVKRYRPASGTVIAVEGKFENHSSFAFYLPRSLYPILAVEGHGGGDLEFGGHLPGAPLSYVSNAELFAIAATRPLFYLTKTPSRLSVPDSLHVLVSDNRATLWSNCVPPSLPAPASNKP